VAKSSNPKNRKTVGRYVAPEARGRITAKQPVSHDHSPAWYGPAILQLLFFGIIVITLNYLQVLPHSASSWYLGLGLVTIFGAFYMATRYK
jgi:Cell division protein CrgA